MKKEVDEPLFTLTREMARLILQYNSLKHEVTNDKIMLTNVEPNTKKYYVLKLRITKAQKQLENIKEQFIKEFRNNNMEAVKEYLSIKDE